jgi:hypothetical protein
LLAAAVKVAAFVLAPATASAAGLIAAYRSLKGTRITNTSGSIRFKIAKGGKLRQVRAEPVRTPKR